MRTVGRFMRQHRLATVALGLLIVGSIVFVLVWFQPQKLLIEETVDEALPTTAAAGSASTPATESPEPTAEREPRILVEGPFSSLEHETTGVAKVVELADGRRILRLEDLSTSNGPDLRVYLSQVPASDDWFAYGERYVDLGALKGNRGNQNYEIPDDLDLSRFKSAVIWCHRFTVGFGVAGLG